MLRVLLFDQETAHRTELRNILQSFPDVCIVGEAASAATAVSLLESASYDLVFLATDFGDGSGFALVTSIRGGRVVFLASNSDQAARAFEVNALDYLIKPFLVGRVVDTLARIRPAIISGSESRAPFPPQLRLSDRLRFGTDGLSLAVVADLCAIVAQENYSIVHLADGTKTLVRRSLKSWLSILPREHFRRVHRSTIVGVSKIRNLRRDGPKLFSLRVEGLTSRVPVGRGSWQDLKAYLDHVREG